MTIKMIIYNRYVSADVKKGMVTGNG